MNMQEMAQEIHSLVCNCDDKQCTLVQEIYDWLADGYLDGSETAFGLAVEWKEREENAAAYRDFAIAQNESMVEEAL